MVGYPQINEQQDRNSFKSMIVGLGHDKEKAEIMYDFMKEMMNLYNLPLSLVLFSAIQEIDLCKDGICQNELIKIADKAMRKMLEVFQSVTDSIRESWENEIVSQNEEQ